jgi:hypothetical protein
MAGASTPLSAELAQNRSVPGLEADGEGLRGGLAIAVRGRQEDVGDGRAVRHHVAVEKLPVAAQPVLQQLVAGAGRLAVDGVVGAHHRLDLGLYTSALKAGR